VRPPHVHDCKVRWFATLFTCRKKVNRPKIFGLCPPRLKCISLRHRPPAYSSTHTCTAIDGTTTVRLVQPAAPVVGFCEVDGVSTHTTVSFRTPELCSQPVAITKRGGGSAAFYPEVDFGMRDLRARPENVKGGGTRGGGGTGNGPSSLARMQVLHSSPCCVTTTLSGIPSD